MKKRFFISLILVITVLCSILPLAGAANMGNTSTETIDLGDGYTGIVTTTVLPTRATETTSAYRRVEVIYAGNAIGAFSLYGAFSYTGTSAKATDDDWFASAASGYDYDGSSWRSGATVKGSCTFSNNSMSKTVNCSITCDKNGNIS